jgi:anti-sigma factor RsiW
MTTPKKAPQPLTGRTCKEITGLLLDYVNDTLSPSVRQDFNRHLRVCPDCVAFLRTYKKTAFLTRTVRVEDLPAKVRRNILDFLREGAKRSSSGS